MPCRRACDRCHKFKEKCHFGSQATECTLCQRSKSVCTTTRSELRPGRRPKVKPLGPFVSIQVWDPSSTYGLSIGASERAGGIGNNSQKASLREQNVEHQASSLASHCRYNGQLPSSVTPPPLPAAGLDSPVASEKPPNVDEDMPRTIEEPFYPTSSPGMMKRFYSKYDIFMLGPSFARGLRVAVQQTYMCSPELLRDILVAISPITLSAKSRLGILNQSDIVKGTGALQKLRSAQITSIHDASAVLSLGQTLAAFDLLTHSIGPLSILRSSLLSVAPWYLEMSKDSSFDSVTITPIFWDTVQCLIRREVPIIKFLPRNHRVVDHTAGLCTTLLPIFYDLCVASNAPKSTRDFGHTTLVRHIHERLLSWVTEPSANFLSLFTDHEKVKMEAQALMFQKAGLLICHRILNPFGTLDLIAVDYAESILKDFSKYSKLLAPNAKLQNVAFPVLMAAFELSSIPKTIWEDMPLLAASPICAQKIRCFVEFVWVQRRRGYPSFIFDLVDEGPEFVVIP